MIVGCRWGNQGTTILIDLVAFLKDLARTSPAIKIKRRLPSRTMCRGDKQRRRSARGPEAKGRL